MALPVRLTSNYHIDDGILKSLVEISTQDQITSSEVIDMAIVLGDSDHFEGSPKLMKLVDSMIVDNIDFPDVHSMEVNISEDRIQVVRCMDSDVYKDHING